LVLVSKNTILLKEEEKKFVIFQLKIKYEENVWELSKRYSEISKLNKKVIYILKLKS
jgi:hypothetical protein